MTRELAAVHAREGIRINALCPCVLPFSALHGAIAETAQRSFAHACAFDLVFLIQVRSSVQLC